MDRAHKEQAMSRLREFWLGWRKEIVRGGLIFGAVVVIGLAITRMFGWIPLGIAQGLGNLENIDFDNDGGHERHWEEAFRWVGPIDASHWVWIRNTNGPVQVEPSESESLMVFADKSSRHSNPESVEIRAVENNGSVTI